MRRAYENVELIRKSRGIPKKKMAENAHISNMACSRVLNGQAKMSADLLYSFANTLFIDDLNIFFSDELTESVINNGKSFMLTG